MNFSLPLPANSVIAQPSVLLVFAKAPRSGSVKTRIAATLGDERALEIYRTLGSHVVSRLAELPSPVKIACTPDEAGGELTGWLGTHLGIEGQGDGDLGARLERCIARELAAGAERAMVIGMDCPEISAPLVAEAFRALDSNDVVFGPAFDGGYYLVGVHRRARAALPALFREIPWSSRLTLAVTLAAAKRVGLTVALIKTLSDIDTEQDWLDWQQRVASAGLP
ncbi:MAG: TIGR04282 family arsenosugar biosynthesis glycosyltransferase [Phycisphaerae bacterium]|nr:TIGR04282 family arsenosugar biosynthesis glycosyltransferase [Gemmatimonadaceae bacterium]